MPAQLLTGVLEDLVAFGVGLGAEQGVEQPSLRPPEAKVVLLLGADAGQGPELRANVVEIVDRKHHDAHRHFVATGAFDLVF